MRIIHLMLLSAALLLAAQAARPESKPDPPPIRCRVQVEAKPTRVPQFYEVTVRLRDDCPPGATAQIRLESYVGGSYPRDGWVTVTRAEPLHRTGIPWYWRVAWQASSGAVYYLKLPPEFP